jgi:predicted extracellular nuclease
MCLNLMKISPIILIFTLTACMNDSKQKNMDPSELNIIKNQTVVFYNVENLFDLENDPSTNDDDFTPFGRQQWDQAKYNHKLQQIALALSKIPSQELPMLIGLVEIENAKVVLDLAKTTPLNKVKYKLSHFNSDDRRGIDCALLYNPAYFQPIDEQKLRVRLPDNTDYFTRDILYVKGAIQNGGILHVFVNHWSSRRAGKAESANKRLRAAEVLSLKLDEIKRADPNAQILIMGDFNDEPKDKSVQHLLANGSQAWLTNLMLSIKKGNNGTIVHKRKWYLFDQFIVSNNLMGNSGLRVKDNKAAIFDDEMLLYRYANGKGKPNSTFGGPEYYGGFSDHLPIFLIIDK